MMKIYTYLTVEERTMIEMQLEISIKPSAIVRELRCSPSTILRELKRNEWIRTEHRLAALFTLMA